MAVGEVLRLLGDETRLRVLHLLAHEPLTVAELQEVLDLGQSSISGHLAKLKHGGLLHDVAEGSSRRYRLREDLAPPLAQTWQAVRAVSQDESPFSDDRRRLEHVRRGRAASWVERVAGNLHRSYAPGRTWESLLHALLPCVRLGRCVDVGAGDGALLDLLAPHATSLTCIDPSPAMVAAGEEKAARLHLDHVRYCAAPGEALPLPSAESDTVLFLQSLQYIPQPEQAIAEAVRVLAPAGLLVIATLAHHDHAEADRYGHCHRGFAEGQLKRWTAPLTDHQLVLLPPEARPPRFQTLVLSARKPPLPAKTRP